METSRPSLSPVALTALIWLAAVLLTVPPALGQPVYELLQGPDDHTRLARIRAFLDGAGWFDDRLYRIDPPDGAVLHWSRLPDLLPAGMIAVLTPVAGAGGAALAAAIATPLIMLGALLAALVWALRPILPGQGGAAAALVMAGMPPVREVLPGSLDHHAWMMLAAALGVGMVVHVACDSAPRRAAAVGGLGLGVGVVVTGETLIALAAVCAATGVLWLWRGRAVVAPLRVFASVLGLTGLALLPVAHPPGAWLAAPCDRFGVVYLGALAGVAAIWWAAPALANRFRAHWGVRLCAGAAVSVVVAATLAALFPHCRGGAMSGVPADQWETWLGHAAGMEPLWRKDPANVVALAGAPAVAFLVGVWGVWRAPGGGLRPALLLMVAAGILATLQSARAANLAAVLSVAPLAWFLVAVLQACERRLHGAWRALGAVAATLIIAAGPLVLALGLAARTGGQSASGTCEDARIRAALASVPDTHAPGLMVAPIFTGPYILTASRHSVLGAQYHRNVAGNRAAHAVLAAPDAPAARRAVERHGVDYIAVCMKGNPLAGAFAEALTRGAVPSWLARVSSADAGPYRIYAVTTPRNDDGIGAVRRGKWWTRQDSNLRPSVPETDALSG